MHDGSAAPVTTSAAPPAAVAGRPLPLRSASASATSYSSSFPPPAAPASSLMLAHFARRSPTALPQPFRASPTALSPAPHRHLLLTYPDSPEASDLAAYAAWQVILYQRRPGQVVLWQPDERRAVVKRLRGLQLGFAPTADDSDGGTHSRGTAASSDPLRGHRPPQPQGFRCHACGQRIPPVPTRPSPVPRGSDASPGFGDAGIPNERRRRQQVDSFVTDEYFRILEQSRTDDDDEVVPGATPAREPHGVRGSASFDSASTTSPWGAGVSSSGFNQGYYEKFFVEIKRLGRGQRGSVFLVQHILEGVTLGEYAVKSIPVGMSHSWLVRQLKEVHLLERLRHPNIIRYKHAWLENRQLSVFGPAVPCLFILMQLANAGSLDEYIQLQVPSNPADDDPFLSTSDLSTFPPQDRIRIMKALRERRRRQKENPNSTSATLSRETERARRFGGIGVGPRGARVRYLTTEAIWSFFSDVCEGLGHLHRYGIIHRDVKPQNLLLEVGAGEDGASKNPDEIPRVLISDFGECEVMGDETRSGHTTASQRSGGTGTLEFMSPELLVRDANGRYVHEHSLKGDMFSLGIVLYFLCYSRVPYSQVDDVDLLREEILGFDGVDFPEVDDERVPAVLKQLITRLLARNPDDRPSIDEVLALLRASRMSPSVQEPGVSLLHDITPRLWQLSYRDGDEDTKLDHQMSLDEGSDL
ncbi:kinase-like domain-containing protein [Zopfochytrium polystomum]|nr:kinase-like domain-containing protein [Zopfochytrium polystomum]